MLRLVAVNDRGLRIGDTHPRAKLSDREVQLMLSLRREGWSYGRLAAVFECAKSTAADICRGRIRGQLVVAMRRER